MTETALVLGASKGLGFCIATECQRRGWYVIRVSGSTPDGEFPGGRNLRCDLTSDGDVRALAMLLKRFEHRQPPLTRCFWVAGVWTKGPFESIEPEAMLRLVDVNFRNVLPILHFAWRRLVTGLLPASFVTIASTSGVRARKDEAVYAATKHAQVGFTRSLALEDRRSDARVALFMPGGMRTHLFDAARPDGYDTFMDPAKVARHLVGRIVAQQEPYLEEEIPRDSALGQSLR